MKKVLAMYLPQFHIVKENNEWWGDGYTEWTAVKNARPWYNRHVQPKVPLNGNYYDLADENGSAWKWQAALAKKYKVDGFCIYHYWFSTGNQLLEKPMEILLKHPEIDINYCVCWANESWTKTWYGIETEILKEQLYGDEIEWQNHFIYLLQFFKDKRYIKVNNKPVVHIYHSFEIKELKRMVELWNQLAINNGFSGVFIVSGNTGAELEIRKDCIDAYYNFEPTFTLKHRLDWFSSVSYYFSVFLRRKINDLLKTKVLEVRVNSNCIYRNMRKKLPDFYDKPVGLGTFPQWDNTPRRKYKGSVYLFTSPKKFENSLFDAMKKSSFEFVYINAWNEWGEGAYIEPDENYKYDYLNAVKTAKERFAKIENSN